MAEPTTTPPTTAPEYTYETAYEQPVQDAPEKPKGFRRFLGTTALVVATVLLGGALHSALPTPDELYRPFVRTGGMGDHVDARTFDAQLLGVRGGAVISSRGEPHDTSGVWVVVKIRITAKGKETSVVSAVIVDGDDRVFKSSGRIDDNPPGRESQPGLPIDSEIAFEVPTDVPLPLSVRLSSRSIDTRMDGMAQLNLTVTRADLRQWAADKTPLKLIVADLVQSGVQGGGA
jgi:hypothetical protein